MSGRERAYIDEAFATNWLSTVGPHLSALEEEFAARVGRPAVAVSSATAAIHLGVRLLGLGPGDEMVTPTLTFVASCNPLLYEGATPVFIDSERRTWGLDLNLLEDFLQRRARVNRLPKAVTVVHLFGQGADMDAILGVCARYELPVLEDAAESLGALNAGRHYGTFGVVGAYSFNGNKIITGTSGGMLVASRVDWAEKARHWSTQARDSDPLGVHNYVHAERGYNYRLSNLLAGVVRGQLEVLEERVTQRRAVFARYAEAFADLPGIEPMPETMFGSRGHESAPSLGGRMAPSDDGGYGGVAPVSGRLSSVLCPLPSGSSRSTRYLSCFLVDEAAFGRCSMDLIRHLQAANVEARPVWKPMHTQALYQGYECLGGAVAEDLNRRGICLPSSSSLTEEEQAFVIERVRECCG